MSAPVICGTAAGGFMCATARPSARLFMRWSDANAKRRWRTPSSLAVVSTKSNRRGRDRPTLAPLLQPRTQRGFFLRMPMSRFRANWTTLVVCALAPQPQTAAVPPATTVPPAQAAPVRNYVRPEDLRSDWGRRRQRSPEHPTRTRRCGSQRLPNHRDLSVHALRDLL